MKYQVTLRKEVTVEVEAPNEKTAIDMAVIQVVEADDADPGGTVAWQYDENPSVKEVAEIEA